MGMPHYMRRSSVAHTINIQLRQQRTTFTTGDSIDGDVRVTPGADVHFGSLEILFLGTSRSGVQRITPVARQADSHQAFHIFLKLSQPDVHDHFPSDNILRAGQTYTFPFVFVVPEHLLPNACRHSVVNDTVRQAHSQLPPTFGDNDLMRQMDLPDDLSPVNTSIRYGVYARLTKEEKDQDEETRTVVLASRAHRIRVIPKPGAQLPPPAETTGDYCLRRERTIRSKKFSKSGAMVVEIERPQSFQLAPPNVLRRDSVSSKASITLRFDPADENALPPQLGKMVIVLKTYTYFASKKQEQLPTKKSVSEDMSQAMHLHQHVLSRRSMAGVEWIAKKTSEPQNHSSREQTVPEPSSAYKGKTYYHARILVPIALPFDATFVPTFHSCLLSRVYELDMRLKVQDGIAGGVIELTMPAHISAESGERRPTYSETMRQDSLSGNATNDDQEGCAALIAHVPPRRRSTRQDSVISYGHFGVRLDDLSAYSR